MKRDCLAFTTGLVPVDARYSAHRIAMLAPTATLARAEAELADGAPESRAQWIAIQRQTRALVARCEIALRRLEGIDAPAPADADLTDIGDYREPIVNALQANIAMAHAWSRLNDESIAKYDRTDPATRTDEECEHYASMIEERAARLLAVERLRSALAVFTS